VRALVVTNMYPTAGAPADGPFVAAQVESIRAAGVDVDLLHLPRFEGGRSAYRSLGGQVKERVAATRPDVLHVMYGGVMSEVTTRVARDRPVIVSFCGGDLLGGRGNGAISSLAIRYGVIASRRAARRAAGIVVKSTNLYDALPRSVDRSRVWIVPNGVDFSRFRPLERLECRARLGWQPDKLHVVFPSTRRRPEKRFELAEAAVSALLHQGVDAELHVMDGVPHQEVPLWLNAAHAVLLTSTHEGSPNAVKEALACNVPVVSVDVGDVRERLTGIEGCFIAEPEAADLAAKLALVRARSQPIDARERIADLTVERVAERILDVYATVTR
jgi:glycosyltransferase involved in cell wall biosynthesis